MLLSKPNGKFVSSYTDEGNLKYCHDDSSLNLTINLELQSGDCLLIVQKPVPQSSCKMENMKHYEMKMRKHWNHVAKKYVLWNSLLRLLACLQLIGVQVTYNKFSCLK